MTTPLHIACIKGDAETIYLLANADNVDLKDDMDCTPLFLAVVHGQKDAVSALMTKNPSLLIPNGKEGSTALREVAKRGDIAMLRLFLPHIFRVDQRPKWGYTPLYEAVGAHKVSSIVLLLDAGADINAPNGPANNTVLHLAAEKDDAALVTYLTKVHGAHIERRNLHDETPLAVAASKGCLKAVEALLEAGADPFVSCGPDRLTPMHIAAEQGHTEIVKRLSQIPGLVNHKVKARLLRFIHETNLERRKKESKDARIPLDLSRTDMTPLYLAAEKGHLSAVEALLEAGAPVDEKCGPFHLTALNGAISGKKTPVVDLLCRAKGIDLEQTTLDDMTPVIYVVLYGTGEMLDSIIKAGAQLNIQKGPRKSGPLIMAVEKRDTAAVLRLLKEDSRIDKNIKEGEGYSPLLIAIDRESVEIVGALLNAGADPSEIYTEKKITALHFAVIRGGLDIIRRLCDDARTEINRRNKKGESALDIVENMRRSDIATLLLSKGAIKTSPAQKDINKAEEIIQNFQLNENDKALRLLSKAHKLDPQNFRIPFLRGQISRMNAKFPVAEKYYLEALDLCKNVDDTVQVCKELASLISGRDRYAEQAKYYEKITELNPDDKDGYQGLCRYFDKLRDYAKVEIYARKALKVAPDDSTSWEYLGEALLKQKKFDEARQSLRFALVKDPRSYEACTLLAQLEYEQGNSEKASEHCLRSLAFKSNNPKALCGLGIIALKRGDLIKAENYYRRALALQKDHPEALQGLEMVKTATKPE